ncbi:putative efflux protein, MATE family [Eubacterium oxidoreducens]|uniref:Putative efflux protein, MATE family n=2 Tax=Eubacterium oxidoreducens TaxID=1732 RepID=A0A1G6CSG8_EUBOX|nr:putative efflux protein, MATE family [Eubacterium oxidoreducens]
MLIFSIPLIITNLLQAIYSIVDMIIVGHFAGSAGLTAVGNGGQITQLILVVVLGMSNGGAVLVAQMIGAKKKEQIVDVTSTMCTLFFWIGLAVTIVIFILSPLLLQAMDTPSEAYVQTLSYLRICLIGTVFIYLYNVMAALLRGVGESMIPMILILITAILNIVLDLILVGHFDMNATGAAIATLSTQVICCILVFPLAGRKYDYFNLRNVKLKIKKNILKNIVKIGLPQAVQFTITNLSFLLVLVLVNHYGNTASAISVSVTRLSSFAVLAGQAMMTAIIAMSGQNIGAGNYARAQKGMLVGLVYALPLAVVFFLLSEFIPATMLRIFTTDADVLATGGPYLQIFAWSFLIETVMFCLFGLLIGAGYTHVTMSCAITTSFAVRYALAMIFSRLTPLGFLGIALAYPFAPVCSCTICIIFILSGRWKKSRIKL